MRSDNAKMLSQNANFPSLIRLILSFLSLLFTTIYTTPTLGLFVNPSCFNNTFLLICYFPLAK